MESRSVLEPHQYTARDIAFNVPRVQECYSLSISSLEGQVKPKLIKILIKTYIARVQNKMSQHQGREPTWMKLEKNIVIFPFYYKKIIAWLWWKMATDIQWKKWSVHCRLSRCDLSGKSEKVFPWRKICQHC